MMGDNFIPATKVSKHVYDGSGKAANNALQYDVEQHHL